MKPGRERGLSSKLGELRVDLHEGVLSDISRLLLVLQNGERRAKRPRLMALDELAKRSLVAIDGERNERAVFLFFHWELHMSQG